MSRGPCKQIVSPASTPAAIHPFHTHTQVANRTLEQLIPTRRRGAAGVRGATLREGDRIISMTVSRPDADLLVVTNKGYGKRTPVSEYRTSNRGTLGVITMKLGDKIGNLVDAKVVDDDDKWLLMTRNGIVIRIRVKDIRRCGRSTQGVKLINVEEGDRVVSVERVVRKQEADAPAPKTSYTRTVEGDGKAVEDDGEEE